MYILTCQRLIFRLIGLPLEKSVWSQRECSVPDVVSRRYGNGNMAAQTTTWPPEFASYITMTTAIWLYKPQHGRYGFKDLLHISDKRNREHWCNRAKHLLYIVHKGILEHYKRFRRCHVNL
jgi:hypothetical protein